MFISESFRITNFWVSQIFEPIINAPALLKKTKNIYIYTYIYKLYYIA